MSNGRNRYYLGRTENCRWRIIAEHGTDIAWMWPEVASADNQSYVEAAFDACIALPNEEDAEDGITHVRFLIHLTGGDPVLRAEMRGDKLVITGIDRHYVEIESEDVL